MNRRAVALLTAGAAALLPTPAVASDVPAFRLRDGEIVESSALALSRSDPRLAYTVNDSGDTARVFSVDTRTGRTVGVTTLAGVQNVDFEALAVAPGGRLLVGDIGDNDAERASVQVHLIDQPGRERTTVRPRTLELSYRDGPRDAEALLVHRGRILVVSKRVLGGEVYRGPLLRDFPPTGTLTPVAKVPGTITGATVLDDGRVVLRNYTAAFVMTQDWEVAQTIALPRTELGESAAAPPDGGWFYAGTEGENSPVYRIDVPRVERPGAAESTAATPPDQAAPLGGQTAGTQPEAGFPWLWSGAGLLLTALAALLLRASVVRRRVRRSDGGTHSRGAL